MPRDLFGDVVHPGPGLGAHARSAVPLSLAGHAVFAAVIIIVPLMATDEAPRPHAGEIIRVAVERRVPQLPPAATQTRTAVRSSGSSLPSSTAAPRIAPSEIRPESPTTTSVGAPVGPVGGFDLGPVGNSVAPGVPEMPAAPQPSRPVRQSSLIKAPVKVRHVPPIYPAIAQQARVEGVVIIEAVVGVDGRVIEARVLRSKPLLDEAALVAVRQWEFTPTTLNGVPVPVIMTVTVNFTLR
ncbi:MAG: TonB family protein [Acidobacteriota bacterium]|nr:TonB family protein [Acidobacteriota bacterium]